MTVEARPSDDEQATAQTISRMAKYARKDSRSELVRTTAHRAIADRSGCPAEAVFWWIRRNVQFQPDEEFVRGLAGIKDPENVEVLVRPVDLLTMPQPAGDCDCISMLCASMLRALGIEAKFRTVEADPRYPQSYSHVYVIAKTARGDLPLDCSHGPHPGWEVRPLGKQRDWAIEEPMQTNLGALWEDLAKIGAQTASTVVTARYAQPPAGTYVQNGPAGSVYYRQPANSSAFSFPGAQLSFGDAGSLGTILVLVVIGAIVFAIARSGGHR